MFLPGGFMTSAKVVEAEDMVCRKTTMEYLTMSDRVELKTLKLHQARRYSTDLDYRPGEFEDKTIEIITGANNVGCGECSGGGRVECERCSGSGKARCPTTMSCPQCRGSGRQTGTCQHCSGSGKIPHRRRGSDGEYRNETTRCQSCRGRGTFPVNCLNCGQTGRVTCSKCGGAGLVDCTRCSTTGEVVCDRCDGAGQLVSADIITRTFSHTTERTYQLTGLAADEFKNGLDGNHFKFMPGDLVSEEFQNPADNGIVLQRQSVHSYDVLSRRYSYHDAEFCLNKITGSSDSKYVASGVPVSKIRTAIGIAAGAALSAIGVAVVALFLLGNSSVAGIWDWSDQRDESRLQELRNEDIEELETSVRRMEERVRELFYGSCGTKPQLEEILKETNESKDLLRWADLGFDVSNDESLTDREKIEFLYVLKDILGEVHAVADEAGCP